MAVAEDYAERIASLNNIWMPHAGQMSIGKALFNDGKKRVFVQCGRKFGKSEIAIYCVLRWAFMNPGQECYYIGPYRKQTKRIAWRRLKRMISQLPKKYIKRIGNNNDLEIEFENGSIIYLDGSDNAESDRGLSVDFLVYEEFKDFKPEYHVGMEPNLAIVDAPLLIIGTPPDHECQYTEIADSCKANVSGTDFWISLPSATNPHISHAYLERKQEELKEKGEHDVWMREYMGVFVKGGSGSIFPMLDKSKHVYDHDLLHRLHIRKDASKLQWYCVVDPGSATAFAGLIAAIDPYNRNIYLLDEVYESGADSTSTGIIWPKLQSKMLDVNPGVDPKGDTWQRVYDQAALWFMAEVYSQFQVSFYRTNKVDSNKEDGISLIKDLLLHNRLFISDRCENLYKEMEGYIKDSKGKVPKKNDHLIDSLRYLLWADSYEFIPISIPEKETSNRRGYSIHNDPTLDDDIW